MRAPRHRLLDISGPAAYICRLRGLYRLAGKALEKAESDQVGRGHDHRHRVLRAAFARTLAAWPCSASNTRMLLAVHLTTSGPSGIRTSPP
ncbi:hypothetical protein FRACA_320030 [Frankia canadensis]|uniref:Uncharacterized protein n=1 Tax=Frankia canadensis TaxID=1836972 RepID=A0A2I2KUJ2_9ACTN|nr:hypothetical protein FRACA_320030 [Frankia canadensis]SOU56621.1 hypothetical protein FRACA_320030 [Frankia canadensis]